MQSTFPATFYALNGREPGPSSTTARDFDITDGGYSSASTRACEEELISAIQNAVKKCCLDNECIYLSLSAGYDSTAILGAVASQRLSAQTFSYGSQFPQRWSDVAIANETAHRLNYEHSIWPMDQYPVEILQEENARLFHFRANRCGELGAWLHFRDKIAPTLENRPLLIFGDECFGWNDCNIKNDEDLLHSIGIVTRTDLIEPFLNPDIIGPLQESYAIELARIIRRAEHLEGPHDKKDYLYFHERVQKVIIPWRQQFAAPFGDVALPLLDTDILSLVGRLPSAERRGKRLMKRAVRAAFPKAFAFRRAIRSGAPALPLLSAWPERYTKSELLEACEQTGLNSHFLDEIERRTADPHRKPSSPSALQDVKAMVKAALKDTWIANAARSHSPPPFTYPSLDLVLSRLQIWVLRLLELKYSQ